MWFYMKFSLVAMQKTHSLGCHFAPNQLRDLKLGSFCSVSGAECSFTWNLAWLLCKKTVARETFFAMPFCSDAETRDKGGWTSHRSCPSTASSFCSGWSCTCTHCEGSGVFLVKAWLGVSCCSGFLHFLQLGWFHEDNVWFKFSAPNPLHRLQEKVTQSKQLPGVNTTCFL